MTNKEAARQLRARFGEQIQDQHQQKHGIHYLVHPNPEKLARFLRQDDGSSLYQFAICPNPETAHSFGTRNSSHKIRVICVQDAEDLRGLAIQAGKQYPGAAFFAYPGVIMRGGTHSVPVDKIDIQTGTRIPHKEYMQAQREKNRGAYVHTLNG